VRLPAPTDPRSKLAGLPPPGAERKLALRLLADPLLIDILFLINLIKILQGCWWMPLLLRIKLIILPFKFK
jgi:hypothetical protein